MKHQSSSILITKNAAQRFQQCGIQMDTLTLLHRFGRRVYSHNGACSLIFDHQARRKIEGALGKAASKINFGAYVVVDATDRNAVITAGHRTSRIREYA